MSLRHDGVTCNACRRRCFRLRRYKCLICHDYDLCGACFDCSRQTHGHISNHPMQCTLTRGDYPLFYAGEEDQGSESLSSYSFTCPLCGTLGFTESDLVEHVISSHRGGGSNNNNSSRSGSSGAPTQVICPICVTQVNTDHNQKTGELARHLMLSHRQRRAARGRESRGGSRGGSAWRTRRMVDSISVTGTEGEGEEEDQEQSEGQEPVLSLSRILQEQGIMPDPFVDPNSINALQRHLQLQQLELDDSVRQYTGLLEHRRRLARALLGEDPDPDPEADADQLPQSPHDTDLNCHAAVTTAPETDYLGDTRLMTRYHLGRLDRRFCRQVAERYASNRGEHPRSAAAPAAEHDVPTKPASAQTEESDGESEYSDSEQGLGVRVAQFRLLEEDENGGTGGPAFAGTGLMPGLVQRLESQSTGRCTSDRWNCAMFVNDLLLSTLPSPPGDVVSNQYLGVTSCAKPPHPPTT